MPQPLRLCILGGSERHRGGLEAYCERAQAALDAHGGAIAAWSMFTDTAYLAGGGGRLFLMRLGQAWRARHRSDIVWLHISNLPDLAFLVLLRLARKRLLVTPHYGANSRLQAQAWRRAICQWALARADRIALLFDEQAAEIDLPANVPHETLGTFLPRSAFADHSCGLVAGPTLHLIHAARFSEAKGSFAMVDICARLKARGIPFAARLVGRGDEATMRELAERIAAKGLERDMEIIPWLDEDAMQAALQAADVLVHLSRIDSFPLIVLEALAAGTLPLIHAMKGGNAMVAAFGGHIVSGREPAGDAAAWLGDASLAEIREAGQAAGARVREAHSWPHVVHTLIGIVSRTLGAEGRAAG